MVKLKINKDESELIATTDINKGQILFYCTWFLQSSSNPFLLPKQNIIIEDVASVNDMFTKVALSGFGEYIQPHKYANTNPVIDYDNKRISFKANKLIKNGETITYCFSEESFPNVTIQ
jgi:hypothetical protein